MTAAAPSGDALYEYFDNYGDNDRRSIGRPVRHGDGFCIRSCNERRKLLVQ